MKFLVAALKKPDYWLLLAALLALGAHLSLEPRRLQALQPVEIKQLRLSMQFEGNGDDINVSTYLPQNTPRQTVLSQEEQSGPLDYRLEELDDGLQGVWDGEDLVGAQRIVYRAQLTLRGLSYRIPPDLEIRSQYTSSLQPHLRETAAIQVRHPEIRRLWSEIRPDDERNVAAVLQAIFNFTQQQLGTVPFKGMTDAITALRLRQASCNGKSRLFIALARLNNLPARLVGGVILDSGQKKTSHQWVEVLVGNQWIPFDPTNDHFAHIPNNYLELYRGDLALFSHTRNINFDYQFDVRTHRVASGVYQALTAPESTDGFNVIALLIALGLDEQTASIFLLFPFCALCITFFRNVVGVSSFGVFMPMLVAAACRYTGLELGLISFFTILFIAFALHHFLEKVRLLKIPRLAAVITVVTVIFLLVIASLDLTASNLELGIIALFPVVIISFTAERLHQLLEDHNWRDILLNCIGTFLLITLCYFAFSSLVLRGLFALFPQLFIVVLALQIFIGRWSGVRASEFLRFYRLIKQSGSGLLGINARNRDMVMGKNTKELMRIANDKLLSKSLLQQHAVAVPPTLARYDSQLDCNALASDLAALTQFVIKPNHGSRGRGIVVIRDRVDGDENNPAWIDAGGNRLTLADLQRHVQTILSGNYSADFSAKGARDSAYIEPLLVQHDALNKIAPYGLSDIRVVLCDGRELACMWRVPTKNSHGKANLHQGAIGVAIDAATGITQRAQARRRDIVRHPDTQEELIGVSIPYWNDIIALAQRCHEAVPLGYLGVDLCIDQQRGPLVLEINARPGLEIQNIKDRGLFDLLSDWKVNVGKASGAGVQP